EHVPGDGQHRPLAHRIGGAHCTRRHPRCNRRAPAGLRAALAVVVVGGVGVRAAAARDGALAAGIRAAAGVELTLRLWLSCCSRGTAGPNSRAMRLVFTSAASTYTHPRYSRPFMTTVRAPFGFEP